MLPRDKFVSSLRAALRHLYDTYALRNSPLIEVFGLADSPDPASELRQLLTGTIRSLQPTPDMPAQTGVWRVYEVLLYRYVQRCSQLEVAEQLGMSTRHLGRQERRALQVLADRLLKDRELADGDEDAAGGSESAAGAEERPCAIRDEVSWLGASAPEESVDLEEVVPSVLDLVRPMANQRNVSLEVKLGGAPCALAVHPVALRQILVSLLSAAIRQASGAAVTVSTAHVGWDVALRIRGPRVRQEGEGSGSLAASLEVAARLAETCGGRLELEPDEGMFAATVTLPALEQLPVLVIDDNRNTLRLLQRYASGTRYRVVGAESLQEGLALVEEASPRIIFLDVMMPDMDGWEVLGRLRQHPLTSDIPVVICTILAEEELALSLGAAGYVRKPVSREGFLEALNRLVYPATPESR